jgi:two-component system, OmpR family, sensor histidine kinase SenX3
VVKTAARGGWRVGPAYALTMEPTTQGVLLTLLGVLIGAITALAWRVSEKQLRGPAPASDADAAVVPPGVATVLNVLRSSALVIDEDDVVLQASAPAYSLGLVRESELQVEELRGLVRQVRRDGETRQTELEVQRGLGKAPTTVQARVAALSSRLVLVLAEDRTRERRVEAIRRDFVANVSHELKTPVGALTLLAEAVGEASDDPEAVQRFAGRMHTEAARLNRLVQQIIELSRLQDDEALARGLPVDVDRVVQRAVDALTIEAMSKGVSIVFQGRHGLEVLGNTDQVALALSNLLSNAVAYSPENSKVVVAAMPGEACVDLTVSDEGIGIPAGELDRIFERFYRVDPARHRSTGGTGLGLSIVKHVAASHGGEVKVWSEEGRGSTFTLRLPRRTSAQVAQSSAQPPAAEPVDPEKENP